MGRPVRWAIRLKPPRIGASMPWVTRVPSGKMTSWRWSARACFGIAQEGADGGHGGAAVDRDLAGGGEHGAEQGNVGEFGLEDVGAAGQAADPDEGVEGGLVLRGDQGGAGGEGVEAGDVDIDAADPAGAEEDAGGPEAGEGEGAAGLEGADEDADGAEQRGDAEEPGVEDGRADVDHSDKMGVTIIGGEGP